jgi:hypothetical protein
VSADSTPTSSPRAPVDGWLLKEQPECKHTPHPEGYVAFADWREEKTKTHTQHRCPVCGLWAIWKPKSKKEKP